MELLTKMYVNVGERMLGGIRKDAKGQTMTEYALLLSGVGIVAYSGYKTMGNAIKSLLTTVDGQL